MEQKMETILQQLENRSDKGLFWYAIRVYGNRSGTVTARIKADGLETYVQKIIPSLLFVRCTRQQILGLRRRFSGMLSVYSDTSGSTPCTIPDNQMSVFMLVTSNGADGIDYLGEDRPEYHTGDRVRVTTGIFQGAEGHVKRIRRDRKLIISIDGVAAVAIAHIPMQLLEKI